MSVSFQWLSAKNRAIVIIGLIIMMVCLYICIFNRNFSFVVPGARNLITYRVSGGTVYYSVTGFGVWQEVEGADSRSLEVISDNYISDKHGVYFCFEDGCHLFSEDREGFSLIDFDAAIDSDALYYRGQAAGEVLGKVRHFEESGQEYFVDDAHVWVKVVRRQDCRETLSLLENLDPSETEWFLISSKYALVSDDHDFFYIYRTIDCGGELFDSWQSVEFLSAEETRKVVHDSSGNFRFVLKDSEDVIFSQGKLKIGFVSNKARRTILAMPGEVVVWDQPLLLE